MKERPILMSAPMVVASLREANPKTQTRRGLKGDFMYCPDGATDAKWYFRGAKQSCWDSYETAAELVAHHSPYGQPGDRLYVRENGWQRPERTAKMMRDGADTWKPYYFDADGLTEQDVADFKAWGFKRRPSIHMPRAHSRILLEVVSVRVERLQDISEADAIAEGVVLDPTSPPGPLWRMALGSGNWHSTARGAYRELWESINGPGSWDLNPWAWVVEFKRIAA